MLRIKGLGARGKKQAGEAAGKPSRGTKQRGQAEGPEENARGRTRRWGRLEVGWPVRRCGSSDYRKRVPSMGSTRVQDIAEDQGVRGQKEEPRRGTKQRKTTRQCRGKTESGGGKDSSLTLRMTVLVGR